MNAAPDRPRFLRALGFGDLWAQVLNAIVGAGIFALPASVAALMGDRAIVSYLLAAGVMALVAASFAELGSAYSKTGGPYLYASDAFGRLVGFQVGWLVLVTRITAYAALLNALLDYLAYFWRAAAGEARPGMMLAILAALAAVNVRGVRWGASTTNALTVAKLVPLLAFVLVGGALVWARGLPGSPAVPEPNLARSTILLVFAFSGFEPVVVPAEEAKNPRGDLPKALLAGLAAVTLLYLGIQHVAARATPDLARSTAPLAAGAESLVGRGGAVVMTAGAVVSILGTVSVGILLVPRLIYALALDRHLPPRLARLHPRYRTPDLAIVLLAAVVFPLAATGSFVTLAALSAIARLVTYAMTCAAAIRLRSRFAADRAFTAPVIVPALGALASLALLTRISAGELRAGFAAIGVGVFLYAAARLAGRRAVATAAAGKTTEP